MFQLKQLSKSIINKMKTFCSLVEDICFMYRKKVNIHTLKIFPQINIKKVNTYKNNGELILNDLSQKKKILKWPIKM